MMPADRRRQRGFTLIETLVAFVLLASVLAVLMQNLSQGMRHQRVSVHYLDAVQIAQSRLAEIPFVDAQMPREWIGPEDETPRWEVNITPHAVTADAAPGATNLYEVVVRVFWRERGGISQFELRTLRTGANPDA